MTRRAEALMGTVASLAVVDPDPPVDVLDEAFAWLHEADRRFSPFKPDSEVSRFGRGELAVDDASADLREVLRLCEVLRADSGGAFDAGRWRPDGRPDPTGMVKGWAAERAGHILVAGGLHDWCLGVGGDVVAHGEAGRDQPWRVGIRHPDDPRRLVAALAVRDLAVATSGTYERGGHILDGRTGQAADGVRSMTVVGPSLAMADGYATAAFAMGRAGVAWVARIPGYGAAAVTHDERLLSSARFQELALPPDGARAMG